MIRSLCHSPRRIIILELFLEIEKWRVNDITISSIPFKFFMTTILQILNVVIGHLSVILIASTSVTSF